MDPEPTSDDPDRQDRGKRWRFRLSAILAFTTLMVFILAGYRFWVDRPQPIGPCVGSPARDLIDPPPLGVVCMYGQHDEKLDGAVHGQVVAVVEDLKEVDAELLELVRAGLPTEHSVEAIHFLEIPSQNHGRLRSFSASGWELSDHPAGAFASVMVLDQLAFQVPPEQRVRFGREGEPTTVEFASGKKLLIEYVNDWTYFFLRKVSGDEQLLRGVRIIPWDSRETVDALSR